jgi:NADPH2:quinone reductase
MKAIRIHEFGTPEVLHLDEVPRPDPGPDQVLIRLKAAGVNYVDINHRRGDHPLDLPRIPGLEGAGVVEDVGAEVTEFNVGDRVAYAAMPGSYAEYVVGPAEKVVSVPDGLDLQQAAGIMLQGLTAHYLGTSAYPIKEGDTVLIQAAAGGVGQILVQIAKIRRARVIGTTSSDEKAAFGWAVGADEMILYNQTDFEKECRQLTDGAGVDVVYDSVGQATFMKGLDSLKVRGTMVGYGDASGPVEPLDPRMLAGKGSLYLTRTRTQDYFGTRDKLVERTSDLFNWLLSGELKLNIDKTFPLADAASAHRYVEARQTKGKVLLIP